MDKSTGSKTNPEQDNHIHRDTTPHSERDESQHEDQSRSRMPASIRSASNSAPRLERKR